jgi:hypothetical protein
MSRVINGASQSTVFCIFVFQKDPFRPLSHPDLTIGNVLIHHASAASKRGYPIVSTAFFRPQTGLILIYQNAAAKPVRLAK